MKKYTIKKKFCYGFHVVSVTITAPCFYRWGGGGGCHSTFTETIEILNRDGDTITYCGYDQKTRRASLQLAPWARHAHGNAPSGTYYGRYIVQLSDGARVSIPVYVGEAF